MISPKQFNLNETLINTKLNNEFASIKFVEQTIDLSVGVGDLVYYDKESDTWVKSAYHTPNGIYIGNDVVIQEGYANGLTGLTPGKYYFMNIVGELTTTALDIYNNIKVGYSISATELLVSIKNIGNSYAQSAEFGDVVFSTVVGDREFGGMVEGVHYEVEDDTLKLKPNFQYKFSSFLLAENTILTVMNSEGCVLYIYCSGDCILEGDIILSGVSSPGLPLTPDIYDVIINGKLFTHAGCGNGGRGGLGNTHSTHYGFGGGGAGASITSPSGDSTRTARPGSIGGPVFGTIYNTSVGIVYAPNTPYNPGGVTGPASTNYSTGTSGRYLLQVLTNYRTITHYNTVAVDGRYGGIAGGDYGRITCHIDHGPFPCNFHTPSSADGRDASFSYSTTGSGWYITGWFFLCGGGGSGGIAGMPGMHLFVEADNINCSSNIDVSGTNGGRGGFGGRNVSSGASSYVAWRYYGLGGYPGGGGGGGSSGNVYLRYTTSLSYISGRINISKGRGNYSGARPDDGTGNNNATPTWVGAPNIGGAQSGQDGNDGEIIVENLGA